jgi:hypothetical protein
MRPHSKIFAFAVLALVLLGACGGSEEDARPGPLNKRYDDMHIARVPLEQRQAENTSRNDWSVAKMENAKAEADYNAVNAQITIVKNDHQKAKLQVSSAISNKKTAEQSADTNQINAATKELRSAELAVKAAEARIKYFEAYRGYLKKLWRYTEETMFWREAQYELAKAQIGQKNNIAPKGVTYDSFPKQEADRSKRAASWKSKVDSEKARASTARETWLKAQQTADQASGTPSSFPDPMLQPVMPTTAPAPATAGTTTPN